jgi:hypothetical protein
LLYLYLYLYIPKAMRGTTTFDNIPYMVVLNQCPVLYGVMATYTPEIKVKVTLNKND